MGYDTIQAEIHGDRALQSTEPFPFSVSARILTQEKRPGVMHFRAALVKKTLPQGKHDEYTTSSDCRAA